MHGFPKIVELAFLQTYTFAANNAWDVGEAIFHRGPASQNNYTPKHPNRSAPNCAKGVLAPGENRWRVPPQACSYSLSA